MAVAVIVDDNEDELQSSLSILKSMGQFEELYGFNCPDEAYSFIKERGCDVLFMETEMNGINCFVLLDKLRKIGRDILYIIMTSNEGYACEAFQKGIADYVRKPLSPESLARAMEKIKKYGRRSYSSGNSCN